MQYYQKITFKREIVLVAVYPLRAMPLARRFAQGQTLIGSVFSPCSDGHLSPTVSLGCAGCENNDPNPNNTFNGDFYLANVPADALLTEDIKDDVSDALF